LAHREQKKIGDDQKLKNDQKLKKIIDQKKIVAGVYLGKSWSCFTSILAQG